MQSEISNIERIGPVIIFGVGCLVACCRFQMERIEVPLFVRKFVTKDPFVASAMICGFLAGTIGLVYLVNAGAPSSMILINGLTLIIGFLLALVLRLTLQMEMKALTFIAFGSAMVMLGTAFAGQGIDGASRWFSIGPFMVQPSLILLPLVTICYARRSDLCNSLAVIGSAIAMAVQPDRAMAAMLFMCILTLSFSRPSNGRFAVSLFCALTLVVTMMLPDHLTAVPFVDHILWTAFDISVLTGLSLWVGCLLLLAPVLFVSNGRRRSTHWVFGAGWLTVIAAAAFGAYPTPIVGYGASVILGYFLSLVIVEPKPQRVASGDTYDAKKKDRRKSGRTDLSSMVA